MADDTRMTLRVPTELAAEVAGRAKDSGRSLNGQICYELRGRIPEFIPVQEVSKAEFSEMYPSANAKPMCPDCGEQLFENRKKRELWCKCEYREPMK